MIRIAIDGPGGAGKSTIAKLLAEQMNLEYIDTGAMYRAIGYKALQNGISSEDIPAIEKMVESTSVDFNNQKIILDGEDISEYIRTPEVSMMASNCSKIAAVRSKLVALQRQIAAGKGVVMDGRDIGTNVLPDAEVKIFMTADPMVRAKRRYQQLLDAGKEANLEEIFEDIKQRDYQDTHRELNPLTQAEDAVFLDTSDMTIDEVVQAITEIAEGMNE